MISGDLAVREEMNKFELMQIWTFRREISPLDKEQKARMKKQFNTTAIPLHVVMDSGGKEIGRYRYNPTHGPADYLKWLQRCFRKWESRKAK